MLSIVGHGYYYKQVSDSITICRVLIRREIANIDPNTVLESWSDSSPLSKKIHQSSPATKEIGNRLSKKDALMSRSWGAGGMPFSVLYMNPHGPRGNHASKRILNMIPIICIRSYKYTDT